MLLNESDKELAKQLQEEAEQTNQSAPKVGLTFFFNVLCITFFCMINMLFNFR